MSVAPTINIFDDDLLSDAQAGKLLDVAPTTVWRWRTKGKRGVRIPSVPFGRQNVTTKECIAWWFAQVQHAEQNAPPQPSRRAVAAEIEAECEALGI